MSADRPLRIAIDASRTTVQQRTGTENYALRLLQHLQQVDMPHQVALYFRDRPSPDLFATHPQWEQRLIPWRRVWTHLRFATELWRTRPDVTFVPAHTLPRMFPGRAVVTVHDLGYIHFPEAHPEDERRYLDWSTRFSAGRATQILADSQATAEDLTMHYNIPAEKVNVVYPGHDDTLAPVKDTAILEQVKAKYGIVGDYLFFMGTLQPRKNIQRLVQAYTRWRATATHPVQLVLGGKAGWLYNDDWTRGVEGVVLTGYIDDADVAALYSGALVFVFPSLYEGFGFPVLEAMACETAVLCSNTSSLPELAGDAAVLVDPTEIDAIAAGIAQLVEDAALRTTLITRGKERLQHFTWDAAAHQTLAVLEKAARQ